LDRDSQIEISKRNYISINDENMATSVAGVFSGGDCTSGPATAVEAIGAGRRAASSINKYLSGQPVVPDVKSYSCSKGELEDIDTTDFADIERIARTKQAILDPEERKKSFAEMEFTLSEKKALKEAERCLGCGCHARFDCKLRELATEYQVNDAHYAGAKHHLPINTSEHPFILKDQNKCILCGRCIRICSEIKGLSVWGFVERGFETRVEPTLGMPLSETSCDSCGLCVSTCPTGALGTKAPLPEILTD
ncbi:MAG: 4Fe-4S binding protein, partial [Dehalococcoidales bacterium]|nr:4Fe-4S binding protein [Dehalococcoidales bacterium]